MFIPGKQLQEGAKGFGISLSEAQLELFDSYARILVEWNEKINLTSIVEPEEIAVKHFLDSLLLLNAVNLPQNCSFIDVGTGAGFPAVPCAIVRPDLRITLLDSLNKRITFLKELCGQLNISVHAIHRRAEEGGKDTALREQFGCATARAVAHMRLLAEYCLPFVQVGGVFAALKASDIDAELDEAKPAIRLLGGKIEDVKTYTLPDGSGRNIVLIRKISQTSSIYPRISAKIVKTPLV